jgi:hypothetical protein
MKHLRAALNVLIISSSTLGIVWILLFQAILLYKGLTHLFEYAMGINKVFYWSGVFIVCVFILSIALFVLMTMKEKILK